MRRYVSFRCDYEIDGSYNCALDWRDMFLCCSSVFGQSCFVVAVVRLCMAAFVVATVYWIGMSWCVADVRLGCGCSCCRNVLVYDRAGCVAALCRIGLRCLV